ncbi:EF hand [Devosia enhydra]|uniref:EF hand n=1 Tax=Devosia enhydra TaxID=665118 RepID=A0A1K2HZ26_9HYPH|nr:hypothetical protein [Devosia enhydra]SFZ85285.1 EF hand [Devosia enhydra]
MKKILGSVAAIGLLAGLAAPAYAQMATTAPAPAADTMTFAGADTNGDGMISLEEAEAAAPGIAPDFFTQADANADGNLDETEFEAFLALATGSAEAPTTNESRESTPSNTSN